MRKSDITFSKIPEAPGVYIFRNARKTILYIGKATSLRSRVRSYFSQNIDAARGPLIVKMLEEATTVEWQETDSVLEALILEANLIKKHQPDANTREKDNKSFNYVVITNEEYPRVLLVRGRELFTHWDEKDTKYVFGPFPSGGTLKEALKIIRKIFPFRDKCTPLEGKLCFNAQIGLCPGVCSGAVTKPQYQKTIRHIKTFLEGKKGALIQQLEKEMRKLSRAEKFEEAAIIKRQIFALNHIQETALLGSDYKVSRGDGSGRIEAYDVAHISETHRVGVMVVVEDGSPSKGAYRKFNIQTDKKGDIAALEEILRRRFDHGEWGMPTLLVIDGGVAQKNAALRVLEEFGYKIPLVNVVKNERHKAGKIVGNRTFIESYERDILLANEEAHRFAVAFHRDKRRKALK